MATAEITGAAAWAVSATIALSSIWICESPPIRASARTVRPAVVRNGAHFSCHHLCNSLSIVERSWTRRPSKRATTWWCMTTSRSILARSVRRTSMMATNTWRCSNNSKGDVRPYKLTRTVWANWICKCTSSSSNCSSKLGRMRQPYRIIGSKWVEQARSCRPPPDRSKAMTASIIKW